ncbi:MAG: methyltransferase [Clostridiales bacterium]|nr:methyltransferase [Clostridiales bacterium]
MSKDEFAQTDLFEKEHIEILGDGISLIVSPEHTFGTDALLLNAFANIKRDDKVCDFGSGCGIIPFLCLRDKKGSEIAAVEIQEQACGQMERSLRLNNTDRIRVFNKDLKTAAEYLPREHFDVVTMNPPYKIDGTGIKNYDEVSSIARHEIACNIDDISKSAFSILRFGGKLCLCHRPERVFDVMTAMHKNRIEPKVIRFVQKRGDTAPWLVLISGRKGGNPGLKVEKPLIMEKNNGNFSDEVLKITEKYRETNL